MILLLPLLLAAAAQGAPAAAAAPQKDGDPAEVFRGICLEGGLAMTREQARPITLTGLPAGARAALDAYAFRADSVPTGYSRPPRPEDIVNGFFELAPGGAYLMTPRAVAGPGSTGPQCAVFWRGAHWQDVRAALRPWLFVPDPAVPPSAYRGRVSIEVVLGGQLISVAGHDGWTMMRAAPLTSLRPPRQAE